MLLDSGGLSSGGGSSASMITALGLSAMNKMGYDVINLGLMEIPFSSTTNHNSFISTSLVHETNGEYLTAPYKLLEINGIKVAVLGITSTSGISPVPTVKNLQADKALEYILPEVKSKADIIILLSDFSVRHTQLILERFDVIDLAIATSGGGRQSIRKTNNGTYIISSRFGCSELHTAVLELNGNRVIDVKQEAISLSKSVVMDPEILKITGYDKSKTLKEINNRQTKRIQKQTMEMAKMDPMEVLKKLIAMENREESEARLEKQRRLERQQEENINE